MQPLMLACTSVCLSGMGTFLCSTSVSIEPEPGSGSAEALEIERVRLMTQSSSCGAGNEPGTDGARRGELSAVPGARPGTGVTLWAFLQPLTKATTEAMDRKAKRIRLFRQIKSRFTAEARKVSFLRLIGHSFLLN